MGERRLGGSDDGLRGRSKGSCVQILESGLESVVVPATFSELSLARVPEGLSFRPST